ncbi:MAG: Rieske 2Fe-2S domain-containing protein [Polaromonas sp.]|uniref:aromatic ring-hydroxylating dioxygenase subunit alpha n=1 Tax=Polaromonas sp. TaxID=1869339 RepID=UPI0025E84655|nr:aromatic ring-hydroxylating dioxygenase subunit alpha [Polaromonas sp.]MBI2726261.1 Rieske 2Fe-2S domain-containing protein [Polaromonas sp.]
MGKSLNAEGDDRIWPVEGYARVPFWIYTDPEIYQRELDLFYYGRSWNYVALECEIPEKGSFKRSWIGERQVVVVRGEHDEVHVWENRCAHRGARLCWKNKGKEESFTCPYHQWNFALDGKLQGVPLKRGVLKKGGMPSDFDNANHGLTRLRVHVENGTIWASFHLEPLPFAEYSGPEVMAHIHRHFPGRKLKLLGYNRQLIPSNWKLYFENLKDPYHATLLHSFLITFGLWRADTQSESIPVTSGHSLMISRNVGKKQTDVNADIARFKDALELNDTDTVTPLSEFSDGQVVAITHFPSVVIHQQANTFGMRHVIPKGVDSFELAWTFFGYEDDTEEMTRLRIRHANLYGPAGYVAMEDGEVLSESQGGAHHAESYSAVLEMGGRDVKAQDHMVTEVLIRAFYKYYREAMGL